MASLPVEPSGGGLPIEVRQEPLGRIGLLRGEFFSGMGALPAVRQLAILFGIAASIALGVGAVLWLQEPDYRPVTGGWNSYDSKQVTELLTTKAIGYRVDPDTGMLLVEADRVADARMALDAEGLLGEQGPDAALATEAPFGSSQQAETNRFLRSLEADLARTITTVTSVKQARVHIAMPRTTAFVRDARKPSASVALVVQPGRELERNQVRAIMNLVARAVPELKSDEVTVVDQQGRLLSGQEDDALSEVTDRQYKFTRQLETDFARKVHDILQPTVGDGRFRVQVAADVDFTWQEETAEQFSPEQSAVRSEQTVEEQRAARGAEQGVPGALSNTPPAVAATPESVAAGPANEAPVAAAAPAASGAPSATDSRREATRNFELDRRLSHIQHPQGRVRRLSVSVIVDDVPTVKPAAGGKPESIGYEPWTDAEIERLSVMVKNAVGYDAARGDVVSVVNAPFVELPTETAEAPPFWTEGWFLELMKMLLVGGIVLAIALGVLRPAFRMIAQLGSDAESAAVAPPPPNPLITDEQLDETLEDIVTLSPSAQSVLASSAGYGPQLDAVRGLIAADPARVAAVIKSWVAIDE